MDNMCEKPMYKCAICGGVYDSIAQRMNCEQTCFKKQEEEERILKRHQMQLTMRGILLISALKSMERLSMTVS